MKSCSTWLIIREMQIKIFKSHLHMSEWLISKRQEITRVGKNVEKREHFHES